ncbi:wax ester/triacylglycerol synthase domain-containing protein [Streptacidiphilus fuscans]|uniref:diacylglycerol O-acyltransferase n=1 Tax=Streptacidiphilus fuscans TaxID=2789292 RepID=A0A931BHP6_9ACTN|nr:wax ester/triacylglycerol synthase domain-containing protein [Streptacidiphilus fuscans]MBF9073650.1 DUF1298 domain-containing protein [Streptacidiphilus fuscans]
MENRLSPLDAAFWSLESPDAPMHIGALAHFDGAAEGGGPDLGAVAAVLAERAQAIPRLRQRVRTPWNPLEGPYWEEQPNFDAAAHIATHAEDADASADSTDARVAALMAAPVPREAPPWEMHLLARGDSGFSLLLKVHHAAVDGLRALDVGVRLLDQFAGREKSAAAGKRRPDGQDRHAAPTGPLPLRALRSIPVEAKRTLRAAEIAGDTLLSVAGSAPRSLLQPTALLHPSALLQPSLLRPEPATPELALPSYPLDDLHRIRKAHGGTVNDVVLAVLAGALRTVATRNARVLVPVSQRARLGAPGGGNRLSGYLLDLPVTEPDPRRRLELVRAAMDAHKQRGPRRGAGAVALLADLLPAPGHRLTAPLLRPTAPLLFDALVTNVPMPDFRFTLDGHTLTALYPLPPLARGQALAVAVSSYRGRLHVGLRGRLGATSPHPVADLHRAFDASLTELLSTC